MDTLTPSAIVHSLDRCIIGQKEAKRTVAVALCNRERRKKLPADMVEGVVPKNILLVGPTGVGKTELARRLAKVIDAPFLRVEATRFTEVGYVGRDVESIVHDLAEISISDVYRQKMKEVENKAENLAIERILNCLCHQVGRKSKQQAVRSQQTVNTSSESITKRRPSSKRRQQMAELLNNNQLEDQFIEIELNDDLNNRDVMIDYPSSLDADMFQGDVNEFERSLKRYSDEPRRRKVQVKKARQLFCREEASKLLDYDEVVEDALKRVEEKAVVFIDEIDKLIGPKVEVGRDVSGEGVQRDLLPFIEGTSVMTRYGMMKTDHMLFIAAGTFAHNKFTDLIPELQGRLPLQVNLKPLGEQDFMTILTEVDNSLTKQYEALLETEGISLTFTQEGLEEIAHRAVLANEEMENIGVRRLHSVLEKVLEELNFSASERMGEQVAIDSAYVTQRLEGSTSSKDLSHYIM